MKDKEDTIFSKSIPCFVIFKPTCVYTAHLYASLSGKEVVLDWYVLDFILTDIEGK